MKKLIKAGIKKAASKTDEYVAKYDTGPLVMGGLVGLPAVAVGKKYLSEKNKKAKNPRGGKPMKGTK